MTTLDHTPATAELLHDIAVYDGSAEFVDLAVAFLRDGIEQGVQTLVTLPFDRAHRVRSALGPDWGLVTFLDRGRRPGPSGTVPTWQSSLNDTHLPRPWSRRLDEPMGLARRRAEVVEAALYERMLPVTLAASTSGPVHVRCMYDRGSLPEPVLGQLLVCHDRLVDAKGITPVRQLDLRTTAPAGHLPLPPRRVLPMQFMAPSGAQRAAQAAAAYGETLGLGHHRVCDLETAVGRVAANAVEHGAGGGLLTLWEEDDLVVADVWDRGRVRDGVAGVPVPHLRWRFGAGLSLVHRLCDLVQIRSTHAGTTVRLHLARAAALPPV